MRLNKRFFFLNRIKQAKKGEKFATIPPMAPEQIKGLLYKNRSFLLQWNHKNETGICWKKDDGRLWYK